METATKKRTYKRRRTPSYKTLYLALLATLDNAQKDEKFSDSPPTHIVTIEDTIEWQYHIIAPNDEAAQNYELGDEENPEKGITLVRMKKTTYCSQPQEVREPSRYDH